MSFYTRQNSKEAHTAVIFQGDDGESSEEEPIEKWSSLKVCIEKNPKKVLYEEGLYHPGSGEICTKYIAQSNSSLLKHPYLGFTAVNDPGNAKALLQPESEKVYPSDGQELYLVTCDKMVKCPVRLFYTNLLGPEIDLCYYGVSPAGVRAMALALRYNKCVKVFNLSENFLNNDACLHLGEMLKINYCLTELNLAGCRIRSEGLKLICSGLVENGILRRLNLERNQLGDEGGEVIAKVISDGSEIKDLILSNNSLGGPTADALSTALRICNNLEILDLSWNNLCTSAPMSNLLNSLSESKNLKELYLSWNFISSDRIGTAICNLLEVPSLTHLDLSNNRLADKAITNIIPGLKKAKKLVTLDLSFNPLSPNDALKLVEKMGCRGVKLRRLLLENVVVNEKFLKIRKHILITTSENDTVITHGENTKTCHGKSHDKRDLVLSRVDFLLQQPKKDKVDIALVALQLQKDNVYSISTKDFQGVLGRYGGKLNIDLINEIANIFPGKIGKAKMIDINLLVDFIKRKWPERTEPFKTTTILPPSSETSFSSYTYSVGSEQPSVRFV